MWCQRKPRGGSGKPHWPRRKGLVCRNESYTESWHEPNERALCFSPPNTPLRGKERTWGRETRQRAFDFIGLSIYIFHTKFVPLNSNLKMTRLGRSKDLNSTWAILSALSLQNWVGWLKCCTKCGSRHRTFRGKPGQRGKVQLPRPRIVKINKNMHHFVSGWGNIILRDKNNQPIDCELSTTGTRETGVSWQKSCKVRSKVAWEVKPLSKSCWIPEKPLQASWACNFSRRSRFSALSKGTWGKKKLFWGSTCRFIIDLFMF